MGISKPTLYQCDRCPESVSVNGHVDHEELPAGWNTVTLWGGIILLCVGCVQSLKRWLETGANSAGFAELDRDQRYTLLQRQLLDIGIHNPHYLALSMADEGFWRVEDTAHAWPLDRCAEVRKIGDDGLDALRAFRGETTRQGGEVDG